MYGKIALKILLFDVHGNGNDVKPNIENIVSLASSFLFDCEINNCVHTLCPIATIKSRVKQMANVSTTFILKESLI